MAALRFRLAALSVLMVLVGLAATALPLPVMADDDDQPLQPGRAGGAGVTLFTNKTQYTFGEAVEACYRVPAPGTIVITNIFADGRQSVVMSAPTTDTSGCVQIPAGAPAGTQCLSLGYTGERGFSGATRTCFQVSGGVAPVPPLPPRPATITTNKSTYQIGEIMQVCYRVPGPGLVSIVDITPDGHSQIFFTATDDGTGGCIQGTVTPPSGTECLRLDFTSAAGAATARTCFQVAGSPWREVGVLQFTGRSLWNFDTSLVLASDETVIRVTSGRCLNTPDQVIVFEGRLRPSTLTPGPVGVATLEGALVPLGARAQAAGPGGHAHITRPVVPNAISQLDISLIQLRNVPAGTPFTVCVGRGQGAGVGAAESEVAADEAGTAEDAAVGAPDPEAEP